VLIYLNDFYIHFQIHQTARQILSALKHNHTTNSNITVLNR